MVPRWCHPLVLCASRSVRRDRCAASFAGIGRDQQHLREMLRAIGVNISSGIHTVPRVLCWQAKMPMPPGAWAIGHWKVRNFAAEIVPSGSVTGRSKSVGPIGAKPRARISSAPAAESTAVKAMRSMPSPRRRERRAPAHCVRSSEHAEQLHVIRVEHDGVVAGAHCALWVPRGDIVKPSCFEFSAALSRSWTMTTAWSIPMMFLSATVSPA